MSSIEPGLIVDYRLFGAPLPRADSLPRTPALRDHAPRLNVHVNLLDGHWSVSSGHWSAELAARYRRSAFTRSHVPTENVPDSIQTSA